MLSHLMDWQLAALKQSRNLRFHPDLVNEAIGLIRSVFGDQWIEEACERAVGTALPFRRHAIGNLLLPPGDSQILDLLELAGYIKSAAGSSVFGDLVAGLKAQYGPTFLQLAFGYRLQRAGVTDVHFEPPVLGGLKGDIGFTVGATDFVAECYIPRNKRLTEEANWLLQKCLELRDGTDGRECVLAISIKLKTTPTSQERKQILRHVREGCRTVESNVEAGRVDDTLFVETSGASISVARTLAVGPGEDSLGRQHRRFPDTKGEQPFLFGRIGIGHMGPPGSAFPQEKETRDSVAIWLSDEDQRVQSLDQDLDEPLRELTRKLERKLAQAKRSADTQRVLIVSSWLTDQLPRASPAARQMLERVLFDKHSHVAAVLFVRRTRLRMLDGVERGMYKVVPLLPERPTALNAILGCIEALERTTFMPPVD